MLPIIMKLRNYFPSDEAYEVFLKEVQLVADLIPVKGMSGPDRLQRNQLVRSFLPITSSFALAELISRHHKLSWDELIKRLNSLQVSFKETMMVLHRYWRLTPFGGMKMMDKMFRQVSELGPQQNQAILIEMAKLFVGHELGERYNLVRDMIIAHSNATDILKELAPLGKPFDRW